MSSKTAVVWDERYTLHEMGYFHPETPRRLLAIKEVLTGDGVGSTLVRMAPREATPEELSYIHDGGYVRRVSETAGCGRTILDPDTSANAHTWEAARLAAGGFLNCVEAVLERRCGNAFAFVRPPGHHAEQGHAMGFCIFNNVAIAAEWLVRVRGLERVAIIDFDVHHGNGTQHVFYDRPDVFYISTHRFPFYPGTGAADELGDGEGRGTTLNIPFEFGATTDDYLRAFDKKIVPAVEKFVPQFLLVSAGFDAHQRDPLGGMRVTTDGFRRMMAVILEMAGEVCGGMVAAVLEGGYDLKALRDSVEVQLEEMVIVSGRQRQGGPWGWTSLKTSAKVT